MDDRGDGVEEGERAGAGGLGDSGGQRRGGQRAGGDDRGAVRQRIDPLAHHGDARVLLDGGGDRGGELLAVDRKRRSGGNAVDVGEAHDQRAQRAHFLMEQADGVVFGIVGTEAVRADHFRQAIAVVGGSGVAAGAHFAEADTKAGLGQLPRRLAPGEPAADDVDVVGHSSVIGRSRAPKQSISASRLLRFARNDRTGHAHFYHRL